MKENCPNDPSGDHKWVCEEIQGELGEVRSTRLLNGEQISGLIKAPEFLNQLCPHGRVICMNCSTDFFNRSPGIAPLELEDLSDKLEA